jgi:hypothetical protein
VPLADILAGATKSVAPAVLRLFFRSYKPFLAKMYGRHLEKKLKFENYNLVTSDPEEIEEAKKLAARGYVRELSEEEFTKANSISD